MTSCNDIAAMGTALAAAGSQPTMTHTAPGMGPGNAFDKTPVEAARPQPMPEFVPPPIAGSSGVP